MGFSEESSSRLQSTAPKIIRRMIVRCAVALIILAALASAGYLAIREHARFSQDVAELTERAGKQRALTNRAGLYTALLVQRTDPAERQSLRQSLSAMTRELKDGQSALLFGVQRGGAVAAPDSVRAVYFTPPHELDRRLKQFVEAIESVRKLEGSQLTFTQPDVQQVLTLAGNRELLEAIDAVVQAYRAETGRSYARLRSFQNVLLGLTLFALLGIAAFIVWPVVRHIRAETRQLRRADESLKLRAAELTATLQELEREREERRSRMQAMGSVLEDLEEERSKLEREIQARQVVQDALEASEQRFYAIIESAPTAMVMTDSEGKIVLANAETERLFGYDRDEILGEPFETLIPTDPDDEQRSSGHNAFSDSEIRRMGAGRELLGRRKDGSKVPVEIGFNPIDTEEGPFVLSAIVDITERKRHEEILRQSEERVRLILDSALDAVVTIDERGNITGWNPQAEVVFGWTIAEVLGKPMANLIMPPNARESHREGLARYLATGQGRVFNQRLELTALRRHGQQFPIEISISPLRVGDRYEFSAFVRDITARKRADEEIKRINKELQRKNNEMQQFVYTVSHDLKSPLVTCRGFVGLMKEDAAEGRWDDVLDSVARIERATQRMGDLIEDLLQLSRIGVIRNEPEEVDVGHMLQGIADELADRLQQAGAVLEIQEPLPHVFADRVRLAEVFENLLSNAIKYGCRGGKGHIQVGGIEERDEVRYFVRDHGPGIAKEFHQKVFGLFQRLESNQEGTGVGLAAVARILEIHGGRVWVESEQGHGATFWVAFPALGERSASDMQQEFPEPLTATPVASFAVGN